LRAFRTVFFGTPDFAVPALRLLISETDVCAVVVRPDRPRGRGRKVQPPPVKRVAAEAGIEVLQPERMSEQWFLDRLAALDPDLVVTAAFGRIVPAAILELPEHGCWNIHASLLPKYRGAAPIQRAIWEGETKTGITLMQMDEGLDTGPVLLREVVPIGETETAGALTVRLGDLGARVLANGLDQLEKRKIVPRPQPEDGTLAPMIRSEETWIDWSLAGRTIMNQVRALAPRPGARTTTPQGNVRILACSPGAIAGDAGMPGNVVEVTKRSCAISAGDGASVAIAEIQPEGRAVMPVAAYLQGRAVRTGDIWGGPG